MDATVSRRSFIAAAGVAGAAVAAAAAASQAQAATAGSDQAGSVAGSTGRATYKPAWLGDAPVIDESQIAQTVESDVVVVGGGNAGSMCAFAAVENGATVSVIESQAADSIFYYGLHDIASLNSQTALDKGVAEINRTQFLSEYQRRSHNRTNPRLVKQFVDYSGEMIDWLAEHLPADVADAIVVDTAAEDYQRYIDLGQSLDGFTSWCGTLQVNYNGGASALIEEAEKNGATWYWETTGIVLETEEGTTTEQGEQLDKETGEVTFVDQEVPQTKVTGVIAQDVDGNYIRFVAKKGVVMACGDYGANAAMYEDLQDEKRWLWRSHGLDTSEMKCAGFGRDGSGIKMCMWAGATMDPNPRCLVDPQVIFSSDTYASNVLRWGASFTPGENPWGAPFVWFDANGERFTNECLMGVFGQRMRAERSKPGRYYAIFDSHWKELMSRTAPEHFAWPMGKPGNFDLEATIDAWVERGAEGAEKNEGDTTCAWGAETLDELLSYMPLTDEVRANIKVGIERYNQFCEQGEDEDYARDANMLLPVNEGPFYGMYCVEEKPMVGTCTLNGVNIDEHQRVLDVNYNPIVGLYATGNNSGGRFAVEYNTPMAGLTIGMAMTLGRQLGKALANA